MEMLFRIPPTPHSPPSRLFSIQWSIKLCESGQEINTVKRIVNKTILRFSWPNGILRLVLHATLVKNESENNATQSSTTSTAAAVAVIQLVSSNGLSPTSPHGMPKLQSDSESESQLQSQSACGL
ncbi:hypothetical protein ACLKA7_003080 [Drosophila subpalustris]